MNLGERIYKLRTEKGMSQGELADAMEVSRQSISKWETNGSVPELDKLIKLSELFGVSLDELVLNKVPGAAQPAPEVIREEPPQTGSARKVAGVVLLCFSVLLWLLIALFGDVLAGLVLAAPFAGCGLICLLVKKTTGLWCAWVVYLFIDIFLRFATGVHWQYSLMPFLYTGNMGMVLGVAWSLTAALWVLTVVTALRTRKLYPGTLRFDVIGAVSGWVVYVVSWFIFALPAYSVETAVVYSQDYRYVSAVSGWVRCIVSVVAMVFTLRMLLTLFQKLKNK